MNEIETTKEMIKWLEKRIEESKILNGHYAKVKQDLEAYLFVLKSKIN